jgi:IclR family KDG regulon transcriptional repressor
MNEPINPSLKPLYLLECFTLQKPNLTLSNIQKSTRIPKSTVFRLLKALTAENYLKYDSERWQYRLGARVLSLGFTVLQNMEAREIARPYLESLSRELNRSTSILMLYEHEVIYIDRIRVPSLRDFNISVGSRIPVYNTAAGRAILAHIEEPKLRKVIERLKNDTRSDEYIGKGGSRLLKCLADVKKHGYAINDQESIKGVRAIAVPVFSSSEDIYSMSVVVPPEEVTVKDLKTIYAPRLMEVGKEVSDALGHHR